MLRNFMKSALATATICLLGVSSATALDLSSGTMKMTGRAGSYWGQMTYGSTTHENKDGNGLFY
jgi:hypothetical protein